MTIQNLNKNIVYGMAETFWGEGWVSHIENASEFGKKPCRQLAGENILAIMPPVPNPAMQMARRLARSFARKNQVNSVARLAIQAYRADWNETFLITSDQEIIDSITKTYLNRFGTCLARMSSGDGISWFDDHAKFAIKVPHIDTYSFQLQYWALDHCQECN